MKVQITTLNLNENFNDNGTVVKCLTKLLGKASRVILMSCLLKRRQYNKTTSESSQWDDVRAVQY